MSGTGWTYMLILTFLTGVAAHGLLVFAQKTIQIGTIGIAQEVQPALAVLWSFLLLGEILRPGRRPASRSSSAGCWPSPCSTSAGPSPGRDGTGGLRCNGSERRDSTRVT